MKIKTAGPGRQPGNFLSKAKESYQRTLCAALGTSFSRWSVCWLLAIVDDEVFGFVLYLPLKHGGLPGYQQGCCSNEQEA